MNGKTVQQGNTADMLFSVDQIIAYVSRFFTLKIGDLIYTGTPVGSGRILRRTETTGLPCTLIGSYKQPLTSKN